MNQGMVGNYTSNRNGSVTEIHHIPTYKICIKISLQRTANWQPDSKAFLEALIEVRKRKGKLPLTNYAPSLLKCLLDCCENRLTCIFNHTHN